MFIKYSAGVHVCVRLMCRLLHTSGSCGSRSGKNDYFRPATHHVHGVGHVVEQRRLVDSLDRLRVGDRQSLADPEDRVVVVAAVVRDGAEDETVVS